jgi:hypothetical protein
MFLGTLVLGIQRKPRKITWPYHAQTGDFAWVRRVWHDQD